MLHFITGISEKAKDWAVSQTMAANFESYRAFCVTAKPNYTTRLQLIVREYPRLLWRFSRLAFNSLMAKPAATTVLLDSDIAVLTYAALNRLLLKRKRRLIWLGYIYTERQGIWSGFWHRYSHGLAMKACEKIITFAASDKAAIDRTFPRHKQKTVVVRYGIGLDTPPLPFDQQQTTETVFSAGFHERVDCLSQSIGVFRGHKPKGVGVNNIILNAWNIG